MNIKQFLIENYIYIIIIILLAIITIIGFLAEKNRGDKKPKKAKNDSENVQGQPNQQENQLNMQYQQQMAQTPNNQLNQNNMINNGTQAINQMGFQVPIENTLNQTVPTINAVEQMHEEKILPNQSISTQSDYQHVPEQQTSYITPQSVPNFVPMSNNINQNQPNMQYQQPVMPNQNLTSNIQMVNPISQETLNQEPNMAQYQQTNTDQFNPNNIPLIEPMPNQGTIPQPMPQIPTPQPIVPQSLGMPNPQPVSTYDNQQGTMTTNQLSGQLPQQPVNFVYGNNNNQSNM